LDFVKELLDSKPDLKLDGVQEERGGTPLLAAHLSGSVQIVALLLLFGAVPDLTSLRSNMIQGSNKELVNTGIFAQLSDLYSTYEKYGSIGVGIDFPEEAKFYSMRRKERHVFDGMTQISEDIAKKKRFQHKKRNPIQNQDLVNSLYVSIEIILQMKDVERTIEEWIQERKDDILNGLMTNSTAATNPAASTPPKPSPLKTKQHTGSFYLKKIPVLSPIYAVTQKYNVNVGIIMCDQSNKVEKRIFYVNPNKKNAFPFIYLAYDGFHYEPIVDIPEEPSGPTPLEILEAIKNPNTTLDQFSNLLDAYDISKINEMCVLDGKKRTLFYCVCRSGRADFVLRMVKIPSISVTGAQDMESGSSPLHVASWYGHVDVIIILLFKDADPDAKNIHLEKARFCDSTLPEEKRKRMDQIFKLYDTNERDLLAQEIDAISSRIEAKILQSNSQPNLPKISSTSNLPNFPNPHATNEKGPVTLEKLCDLLKGDSPPPVNVFQDYFRRFDKKFVNDFSLKEKCTPFYLACRSGSLEIVMEFMEVDGIKLTGQQETRTGEGSTPLHVANWRGHVPVVAYLLTRVEPEPKANGNIAGQEPEIYPGKRGKEDDIKRNQLAKIFLAASRPHGKEERLRPYWQDVKLPKPMPPIPLSVTLSLPQEEVPPQYLRLTYLWYEKKGSKLTLLELHVASCLDVEYSKWCEKTPDPDTTEVEVKIYTPPVRGTIVWTMVVWKVNFKHFVVNVPGQGKVLLYPIKRAQIWYMKSKEGPLIPFSNKINVTIGEALHKKLSSVRFTMQEGLFIFKKKITCTIDFQTRQATMSDNLHEFYPIIHEGEYAAICSWRPEDIKFTERRSVCMEEANVVLQEETEEWKQVSSAFYSTIPQLQVKKGKLEEANRIVEIRKLYHPSNRDTWKKNLDRTLGYHKDNPVGDYIEYKKILWHGTGSLDPQVIWSTPGNWKPNYSSDKNLWGRGCYFASDAAYSANYAYTKNTDLKNPTKILLLAEVIVGQPIQCLENSYIVDNPPNTMFNCVVGYRHGAWIYVVYEPALAFPVYSVEWKQV